MYVCCVYIRSEQARVCVCVQRTIILYILYIWHIKRPRLLYRENKLHHVYIVNACIIRYATSIPYIYTVCAFVCVPADSVSRRFDNCDSVRTYICIYEHVYTNVMFGFLFYFFFLLTNALRDSTGPWSLLVCTMIIVYLLYLRARACRFGIFFYVGIDTAVRHDLL